MPAKTFGLVLLLLLAAQPLSAVTILGTSVAELTSSASTVFRGECVDATAQTAEVAGATIAVTEYRFHVTETLAGAPAQEVSFRQVGTPTGGRLDLGRLAGLPVYQSGREYVLFLLPPSRFGLTSPSGAGEGAFAVHGDAIVPLRGLMPGLETSKTDAPPAFSYAALRAAVLEELGR